MYRNQHRNSFRPSLEVLESRACLSCTISLDDGVLTITGDAADNEIAIFYNGPGDLSVECDGTPYQFSEPIDRVDVRGGRGDDNVLASLLPADASFPGAWTFDLGQGDDIVGILAEGIIEAPASITLLGGQGSDSLGVSLGGLIASDLEVAVEGGNGDDFISNGFGVEVNGHMTARVLGGNGDDTVFENWSLTRVQGSLEARVDGGNGDDFVAATLGSTFDFGPGLPLVVAGFDVAAGGQADCFLTGGNGDDMVLLDYLGRIDGRLNLVADGGRGGDEIVANLDINVESTGQLSADFHGGRGNDHLEVRLRFIETDFVEIPEIFPGFFFEVLAGFSDTPAPLGELSVTADGGSGFDTCLHSALVDLFGIEDDQPI